MLKISYLYAHTQDAESRREPPGAPMSGPDTEAVPRVIAADPPVPIGRRRSPPPGFRGLARAFSPRLAAAPRGHAPPLIESRNPPALGREKPTAGEVILQRPDQKLSFPGDFERF